MMLQREEYFGFRDIMRRLEKRTTETVQVKLQSLRQMSEEGIEEWADRVLHLATCVFQNLPEIYMNSQVIHNP
jgi:hypothetical protein